MWNMYHIFQSFYYIMLGVKKKRTNFYIYYEYFKKNNYEFLPPLTLKFLYSINLFLSPNGGLAVAVG